VDDLLEISREKFSCNRFSRKVMERICDVLAGTTDLEQQVRRVQEVVASELPHVQDDYARLRHARAILEVLLPEISAPVKPVNRHPIPLSVLCELGFLGLLRQGTQARTLLAGCRGALELVALYRALLRSPAIPPLEEILEGSGRSPYLDALVRDLLRKNRQQLGPEAVAAALAGRFRGQRCGSRRWYLFAELIAENRMQALDPGEVKEHLERCGTDPETLCTVLRIIGDCGYDTLLTSVQKMLERSLGQSPRVVLGCLETIVQIGNGDSICLIDALFHRGSEGKGGETWDVLRQYGEAMVQGLKGRFPGAEVDAGFGSLPAGGPVLVQVVLNPNPQAGGAASVGGVLTFLHSIGDALAAEGSLGRVVTLEVVPWNMVEPATVLEVKGKGRHSILRVPVHRLPDAGPEQLMIHESAIRRSVELALRSRGIRSDLLHIRYTDNLAKAMLVLAEQQGCRLVFTLTADPHRDFVDPEGVLLPMSEERTLFNLNKVFIADTIIENAAGILGIAHGGVDAQLLTYFPKLCLSPEIQRKPVRVIPEGIRLEFGDEAGPVDPKAELTGRDTDLSLLSRHSGKFVLADRYNKDPVILNVGRLVPAKGQHRLVQAWARSALSGVYNLVLIGGNLSSPSPEEEKMLEHIEQTMQDHPPLSGRLCHLPALDNDVIRRLERALADGTADHPQVYLCSSLKEEFGISILEAMAAGFLALAPFRGGVPTYIEHGESGYLIDTATAASIQEAAERILLSQPEERLRHVAAEGRRFIRENFGIGKIAGRFADFYMHVYDGGRSAVDKGPAVGEGTSG
jgi:glycosyltransferase involved in cell wall biosynthesis